MLSRVVVAAMAKRPQVISGGGSRVLGVQTFHTTSKEHQLGTPRGEIYQKQPVKFLLEKGKIYHWCACGLSSKQPFCDGSHKESKGGIKPIKFTAEEKKEYFLCNCKQTNQRPYCDGTHKTQ